MTAITDLPLYLQTLLPHCLNARGKSHFGVRLINFTDHLVLPLTLVQTPLLVAKLDPSRLQSLPAALWSSTIQQEQSLRNCSDPVLEVPTYPLLDFERCNRKQPRIRVAQSISA